MGRAFSLAGNGRVRNLPGSFPQRPLPAVNGGRVVVLVRVVAEEGLLHLPAVLKAAAVRFGRGPVPVGQYEDVEIVAPSKC